MEEIISNLELSSDTTLIVSQLDLEKDIAKIATHLEMKFWIVYPDSTPELPALTLLVNPNSMNLQYTRIANPTFTRSGPIPEQWGDDQDLISVSGKMGGFYLYSQNGGTGGLTRYDRKNTTSFRNMFNLYLIYKNNGYLFQNSKKNIEYPKIPIQTSKSLLMSKVATSDAVSKKTINLDANNRIAQVGKVCFSYDNMIYEGSFNEFSMDEDAKEPFTLSYDFTFTVRTRKSMDHRTAQYKASRGVS